MYYHLPLSLPQPSSFLLHHNEPFLVLSPSLSFFPNVYSFLYFPLPLNLYCSLLYLAPLFPSFCFFFTFHIFSLSSFTLSSNSSSSPPLSLVYSFPYPQSPSLTFSHSFSPLFHVSLSPLSLILSPRHFSSLLPNQTAVIVREKRERERRGRDIHKGFYCVVPKAIIRGSFSSTRHFVYIVTSRWVASVHSTTSAQLLDGKFIFLPATLHL